MIHASSPTVDVETQRTFSTPALVVDLDTFERNVRAMSELLEGTGKTVRPHVKTHRTPELARRQLGGSARGVTCATVGEAEVMVAAGITDVLLANELVDPLKMDRLVGLAHEAAVTVAADDPEPVTTLSTRAARAGVTLGVLIDVDVLLHRCGVASAAEVLQMAAVIDRSPGLRLDGLMGYEGRLRTGVEHRQAKIGRAYALLAETRDALLGAGFAVESSLGCGNVDLVGGPGRSHHHRDPSRRLCPDGAGTARHGPSLPLRSGDPRHGDQPAR